jgi:hypothetical protein
MAKGPKVTQYAQGIIAGIYDEHPNWRAQDIQYQANKMLNYKGPGLSYVQKFLAERSKQADEIDTRPDLHWSLGSSAKYNIPPEANRDLLNIWKWCTVVGMTFTIREAQWVARLRGLVPFPQLYSYAVRYALRERVCLLMGWEKVSTTDLDRDIVFPGLSSVLTQEKWMISTTRKFVTVLHHSSEKASFSKHERTLDFGEKEFFAMMTDDRLSSMVQLYLAILPKRSQTLSVNADIVYTLWLRLLANGKKWKRMTEEVKNKTAQQLYEEVALAEKQIKDLKKDDPELPKNVLKWEPSIKLLREVGLSEDRTEWKLVSYESERAGRKPL